MQEKGAGEGPRMESRPPREVAQSVKLGEKTQGKTFSTETLEKIQDPTIS